MKMLISKFDNQSMDICLEVFEKKYSITLPEKYRKFLMKYNGGETPDTEFRINKISSDIQGFYGLGKADKYYNFSLLEKTGILTKLLTDKMLPIAKNMFGDFIVINVGMGSIGGIYFYYHDRPKKFIELTEDFETFIDKCKSKKIGHIPTIQERKEYMIKLGKGNKITPEKIAGWQAEIDEYKNIHQEKVKLN